MPRNRVCVGSSLLPLSFQQLMMMATLSRLMNYRQDQSTDCVKCFLAKYLKIGAFMFKRTHSRSRTYSIVESLHGRSYFHWPLISVLSKYFVSLFGDFSSTDFAMIGQIKNGVKVPIISIHDLTPRSATPSVWNMGVRHLQNTCMIPSNYPIVHLHVSRRGKKKMGFNAGVKFKRYQGEVHRHLKSAFHLFIPYLLLMKPAQPESL